MSKSAKNKTNKTIQNTINGLAIVMSSNKFALKPTVTKSIADTNAAKKMQQISVASSASTTSNTDASTTDALTIDAPTTDAPNNPTTPIPANNTGTTKKTINELNSTVQQ